MAQATHTEIPRQAPPGRMSYEEFLPWCDEDTWAAWVDGEVVILSPALERHQDLAAVLTSILRIFTEVRELGIVRPAPFYMKLVCMRLGPSGSGREPDLLFVAREHLHHLRPTLSEGPADLVVEITSPESFSLDRGEKYVEYETAGIPEYWLIDPDRQQAEFSQLSLGGRCRVVLPDTGGIYRSTVLPGFWLRVAWL